MAAGYHRLLRGHLTPADKARSDYAYVPFTLPQPARRLHVRYRYSDAMASDQITGGNVIDIGLFDPRGAAFPGGAGFRGWSGSARSEFTITPEDATPGYVPGPLPAGDYQVILGLYRIWAQGADYEIEIDAEPAPEEQIQSTPAPPPPAEQTTNVSSQLTTRSPSREQAPPGRKASLWLRGDLQSHTVHSDAKGTLEQLTAKARALGLNFLAVTDHNTVSHHPHLPALAGDDLLLIPGQEATTYYGHMNIWGTNRWCDFRCQDDAAMAAIIDLAHRSGGVCSINHPKQGGPAWAYSTDLPVDAMEVWQGPWPHRNAESLALWDRLLDAGRRLPAVGGSDYHCPAGAETNLLRLGQPTTWVQVRERSTAGILEAIRAGRACISASPTGPRLELTASNRAAEVQMGETIDAVPGARLQVQVRVGNGAGRTLRLVADGQIAHEQTVSSERARLEVELPVQRYVRAELAGDMDAALLPPEAPADLDLRDWRWALSNPIYVR